MAAQERTLPAGYNENVLVLLVQSPYVVFAYLELSDNFWRALAHNGRAVLRLYEVTPEDPPVTETVLPPFTTNWYFRDLAPGRSYVAELGWRDEQGLFVSLVRSNPVATPANEPTRTGFRRKMGTPPGQGAPELPPAAEHKTMGLDLPSSYSF